MTVVAVGGEFVAADASLARKRTPPRMVPKLERRLRNPSVVAKHPTKAFMAIDQTTCSERTQVAIDQPVSDFLMVPLAVVVLNVLAHDSAKMSFSDRTHLGDAF